MNVDHYTYRVTWSADDESFVGTVAEFPSLSWLSEDISAALTGIRDLVSSVVADMLNLASTDSTAENPPEPIADRNFSGKFMVRVTPELHRKLYLEAAEQKISMNRVLTSKLASV